MTKHTHIQLQNPSYYIIFVFRTSFFTPFEVKVSVSKSIMIKSVTAHKNSQKKMKHLKLHSVIWKL